MSKKRLKPVARISIAAIAVCVAAVSAVVVLKKRNVETTTNSVSEEADEEKKTVAGDIVIENPEMKESEYLVLSSLYTSTMFNPDGNDELVEELATIEVTNSSNQYLQSAAFTAKMSDDSEIHFIVNDLPAGKTAELFDTGNRSLESNVSCISVTCDSEEYIDVPVMIDQVEVTSVENGVLVTNVGEETLNNLKVVYHWSIGNPYFGGTSMVEVIEVLNPGESHEIAATNIVGEIQVSRIYQ